MMTEQDSMCELEVECWWSAMTMVMSDHPQAATISDKAQTVDLVMVLDENCNDELPEPFVVWEPFENYSLKGIQKLIEDFKYALYDIAEKSYSKGRNDVDI